MATIYKSGDKRQIICPVDGTVAIAKGDLLYLSAGNAFPFSNLGDSGSKLQNQQAAVAVFLGVAGRAKAADSVAGTIPVYTAGTFEFVCASASYAVGDMIGPQGTGASSAVGVSNTNLEAVATVTAAIGRVVRKATSATTVQVSILSSVLRPANGLVSLAGSGGTVTQITSSSTGVTLNKLVGTIVTVALTTAAAAEEVFTVSNELVGANDIVLLTTQYAGAGTIMATTKKVAAGAFDVVLTNLHATNALNAAVTLNFIVLKGATS